MRGIASAGERAFLPRSLMQRLALVANGGILPASGGSQDSISERLNHTSNTAAFFGLGVFASTVAGGVAFLALPMLTAQQGSTPDHWSVPAAIAALAPWAEGPVPPPLPGYRLAAARDAQPDAFDMVINRSERARAPFGLRLIGTEAADFEIVLRDVPAATSLSRGERRDGFTWALKPADLRDLHVTISDGTPDAFDVKIDVAAPTGVAATSAVARVRLIDGPSNERSAAAAIEGQLADAAVPRGKAASSAGVVDTPFQTQTTVASRRAVATGEAKAARPPAQRRAAVNVADANAPPPQAAPTPQPRPWPEGASALGAIQRESERQVWWKMPSLTWPPFLDSTSRP